jgi:hypothetical protein
MAAKKPVAKVNPFGEKGETVKAESSESKAMQKKEGKAEISAFKKGGKVTSKKGC